MVRTLVVSAVAIALAGLCGVTRPIAQPRSLLRLGIVTDVHHADTDPNGARTYRASAAKLTECVRVMNEQRVDLLVELGDFKDQDKTPDESRTLTYLREIEAVFAGFNGPRYHVVGNHDNDSLSKTQFLSVVLNAGLPAAATHYTFVQRGIRFVVLDANHKADGSDYDHGNFDWTDANIDTAQLAWFERTLSGSREPVVVMVHQQLDGEGAYYVKNARAVRAMIEASGNVIAVFQGHRHEGAFSVIAGVPYVTFRGLIEGPPLPDNAFSIVEIHPDLSVWITGFARAESRSCRSAAAETLARR